MTLRPTSDPRASPGAGGGEAVAPGRPPATSAEGRAVHPRDGAGKGGEGGPVSLVGRASPQAAHSPDPGTEGSRPAPYFDGADRTIHGLGLRGGYGRVPRRTRLITAARRTPGGGTPGGPCSLPDGLIHARGCRARIECAPFSISCRRDYSAASSPNRQKPAPLLPLRASDPRPQRICSGIRVRRWNEVIMHGDGVSVVAGAVIALTAMGLAWYVMSSIGSTQPAIAVAALTGLAAILTALAPIIRALRGR